MSFSTAVPIMVQQELADAGPYINNQATMISDQLRSLASYLSALPETWRGGASFIYQGLQDDWNAAAEGLFGPAGGVGVLGQIATTMNVAWVNYSDAESANSQTWAHG
jgi:uncharacterized protein YukE